MADHHAYLFDHRVGADGLESRINQTHHEVEKEDEKEEEKEGPSLFETPKLFLAQAISAQSLPFLSPRGFPAVSSPGGESLVRVAASRGSRV